MSSSAAESIRAKLSGKSTAAPSSAASSGSVKRSADWMKAGGDGSAGKGADLGAKRKALETSAAAGSIRSKLSAGKAAQSSTSLEDARKQKLGSFSAGLTKEQIMASQQQHREKMEASGKPVPHYSRPR